jgi:hypothetical protein
VVSAHEVLHDAVKGGDKGLVLMFDYGKAYDRVSWLFLEEMLLARGLATKWITWIMKLLKGGIHFSKIK